MDAHVALNRLKTGNENYVQNKPQHPNGDLARRNELHAEGGQAPFAIILSCADSRVVPELIFDQGIGDLFVVRVAGNISNPSSIASIEYAVDNLNTRLIVVMGHESCGAVGAAIKGGDNGPNLNHLLEFIQPAVETVGTGDVNEVVKINAENSCADMLANSEILQGFDDLMIVPAYYNLVSGKVEFAVQIDTKA